MNCTLSYDAGTILITSEDKHIQNSFHFIKNLSFDQRINGLRTHAYHYRSVIRSLIKHNISFTDEVRAYNKLNLQLSLSHTPYNYQEEALSAWSVSKWGIVVLPTGAGKSFLAALCIEQIKRSVLIIVPTIDLMRQWKNNLQKLFQLPIGSLGGGEFLINDITVSTYDSARIHLDRLSTRFCLVIFDECHHLPAPAYMEMARGLICPYRLGLTATPPEEPERITLLQEVCGNTVYSKAIPELTGDFLAPYRTVTIRVQLTADEQEMYDFHRSIYLNFKNKLLAWGYKNTDSWENFTAFAGRTKEGRQALKSFAVQKQLAAAASEKLNTLRKIIIRHKEEQILIFTNDNKTGYIISSLFFLPFITHETPTQERKDILARFNRAEWPFLVSSRVLNEGIDVPEASVAVVISGTSTVREHVQRLGRILRKKNKKQAVLYEIVTEGTGEVYTSRKRRMHDAYRPARGY